MKKAKNIIIGSLISIPKTQFAPYRQGWNGWIFENAKVIELLTNGVRVECESGLIMTRKYEHVFEQNVSFDEKILNKYGLEEVLNNKNFSSTKWLYENGFIKINHLN